MAAKFRKNPIEIEAVQLNWANWDDVCEFIGEGTLTDAPGGPHAAMSDEYSDTCGEGVDGKFIILYLFTMHGDLTPFRHGDWIIPDGKPGTFYPCKPDVFAATYSDVDGLDDPIYSNVDVGDHRLTWRELVSQRDEQLRNAEAFARIIHDLSRNEHGRHEGDVDGNSPSLGNPHLPVGTVFGYSVGGSYEYAVPPAERSNDPEAWRRRAR